MTAKDYQAMARAIASEIDYVLNGVSYSNAARLAGAGHREQRQTAVLRLTSISRIAASYANAAEADNDLFDRARFAVACHLPASLVLYADTTVHSPTCHGYALDGTTKVEVL